MDFVFSPVGSAGFHIVSSNLTFTSGYLNVSRARVSRSRSSNLLTCRHIFPRFSLLFLCYFDWALPLWCAWPVSLFSGPLVSLGFLFHRRDGRLLHPRPFPASMCTCLLLSHLVSTSGDICPSTQRFFTPAHRGSAGLSDIVRCGLQGDAMLASQTTLELFGLRIPCYLEALA